MAKFVTNLDLNFNELQNAVLNPVAEDPTTLKEGMVWYNTAAKEFRCYKDGKVKPLGAQASVETIEVSEANQDKTDAELLPSNAQPGDMAIVKRVIAGDKVSHTAYVYDGDASAWKAMDGNYRADNVYFDDDITYTVGFGTLARPSGSAKFNAKGKSLEQVLSSLMAQEAYPSHTNPAVTISGESGYGTFEVGTLKNLAYTGNLSAGSYTYGPETGITATSWSASCTGVTETKNTKSGTFENVMADTTVKTVTVTAHYGDGAIPVTNLGNPYASQQIKAGSASKTSSQLKGVRYMFWGPMADADMALNSANIRALAHKEAVAKKTLSSFGPGEGAKKVVVAVPAGHKITKVLLTSSMNADITSSFVKQSSTVSVEGANNYAGTAYDVYVYQPASIDKAEVYAITIG